MHILQYSFNLQIITANAFLEIFRDFNNRYSYECLWMAEHLLLESKHKQKTNVELLIVHELKEFLDEL